MATQQCLAGRPRSICPEIQLAPVAKHCPSWSTVDKVESVISEESYRISHDFLRGTEGTKIIGVLEVRAFVQANECSEEVGWG